MATIPIYFLSPPTFQGGVPAARFPQFPNNMFPLKNRSLVSVQYHKMIPSCSNSSGAGCSWMKIKEKTGESGSEVRVKSVFPKTSADVSSVENLFEFICSGPLVDKIGLTSNKVAESIDKWIVYGSQLCRLFNINELFLSEAQKIGFSAPQGCGKTTLVLALKFLLNLSGRNTEVISIDDFYLTAEDQAKLREANPGNALLEFRGNAGSHDLSLSIETLTSLKKLTKQGQKMKIPRYNKSAYRGRGDREDPSKWPEAEGPLTVVLFEGWMLGFRPLPVEVVKSVDPQLVVVNKNLEAYNEAWDQFISSWIVIKIQNPSYVYQWRLQAEIGMREAGKASMTDDEVRDFVSRYMPAYKAYLPTLYAEGPNGSDPNHSLIIDIDEGDKIKAAFTGLGTAPTAA